MRAVVGIVFATFLLAGGALGGYMFAGPFNQEPSPSLQALGNGPVSVPAQERYDLSRDLVPAFRMPLGTDDAPFLDVYMDGAIVNEKNLTFYGPDGPTLRVAANGTLSFPGQIVVDNVTATKAWWPYEIPEAGVDCWDLNGDHINDTEEDINGDGIFDGFDCTGIEGPEGPQGRQGLDFGIMGPRGPTGPKGFTGKDAHVLLFDAVELPVPGPCPYGGRRVFTGIDDGHPGGIPDDGILQKQERNSAMELCYGPTGSSGPMGPKGERGDPGTFLLVIRPTEKEFLAACAEGGVLLVAGFDDGRGGALADDGVLSDPERIATAPLCFGTTGAQGAQGVQGPAGPQGAPGIQGEPGVVGDQGIKGLVGDQGASGKNGAMFLTLTERSDLGDCPTGGTLYRIGIDDGTGGGEPGDGALHPDEVVRSFDICRGDKGPTGEAGTKWNHTAPQGHRTHNFGDIDGALAATLNSESWPQIAYRDAAAGELRLVRCGNPDCDTRTDVLIDNQNDPGHDIAIAVGLGNIPHVAYTNAQGEIWLAKCKDLTCTAFDFTQLATGLTATEDAMDMVIAGHGCPTVAYRSGLAGVVDLYAVSGRQADACTSWATTKLYSANDAGYRPHMAVQWSGNPAIVFWDDSNGRTMQTVCQDPMCTGVKVGQTTTVVLDYRPVGYTIGANGYGVALVEDTATDELFLAACQGTIHCGTPTVEKILGGFLGHGDLSVGHDGLPAVVAQVPGTGLIYAKCHDKACEATSQHTFASGGESTTIVTGFNDLPILVHRDAGAIQTLRLGSPYGPAYLIH